LHTPHYDPFTRSHVGSVADYAVVCDAIQMLIRFAESHFLTVRPFIRLKKKEGQGLCAEGETVFAMKTFICPTVSLAPSSTC